MKKGVIPTWLIVGVILALVAFILMFRIIYGSTWGVIEPICDSISGIINALLYEPLSIEGSANVC